MSALSGAINPISAPPRLLSFPLAAPLYHPPRTLTQTLIKKLIIYDSKKKKQKKNNGEVLFGPGCCASSLSLPKVPTFGGSPFFPQGVEKHENNYRDISPPSPPPSTPPPQSPLLRVIINHAAGRLPGEQPRHQAVNCTGAAA